MKHPKRLTPEKMNSMSAAIRRAPEAGLGVEDIAVRSKDWECGPIPEDVIRWFIQGWRISGQLRAIVRAR